MFRSLGKAKAEEKAEEKAKEIMGYTVGHDIRLDTCKLRTLIIVIFARSFN